MSYLEQSTRYVPYTERPNGRWKYVTPAEINDPADRRDYREVLDHAFETYARFIGCAQTHFRRLHPRTADDQPAAYDRSIRAKALDTVRGLLPAATRSNLGIHGSGHAFEALLLRLGAHELDEAQRMGTAMLAELREVIPAFVQRVDREDRGQRTIDYLRGRALAACLATRCVEDDAFPGPLPDGNQVRLIDWKGDGEAAVLAAALYPHTPFTLPSLQRAVEQMPAHKQSDLMRTLVGERENRRHRPGRAFEHADYTFEITTDYGAFRDLQRHRMLTIDWQPLTTLHGAEAPAAIDGIPGLRAAWSRVMEDGDELYQYLFRNYGPAVAQYAVPMAFRIRFTMRMNAREAMHVIELRTQPAGHPSYRRICQRMHRLIRDQAGPRSCRFSASMRPSPVSWFANWIDRGRRGLPAAEVPTRNLHPGQRRRTVRARRLWLHGADARPGAAKCAGLAASPLDSLVHRPGSGARTHDGPQDHQTLERSERRTRRRERMTRNERSALEALQDEIDRERTSAECPCVRALLVILSNGLARIAHADQQERQAA